MSSLSTLIANSETILPAGRRAAMAATVEQIEGLGKVPHMEALWAAFDRLAEPKAGDAPPVAARRKTCREFADLIKADLHGLMGFDFRPSDAAPWFQAQIDAWTGSTDPRQAAMAATATRELAELTA